MKLLWTNTQLVMTAIGGFVGWFLGGYDGFIYALLIFVIVDYLTGIMVAVLEKQLSSEVGAKGICKKLLIFTLVGIANVIDSQLIGTGSVIRTAVIFFYLSNEGISIIENATSMGLPIPHKLQSILAQLSEGDEKNE
ncbi:MAG: phage holin family protein [Clostridia bacterium]